MRRMFLRVLAASGLAILLTAGPASAQEFKFTSYSDLAASSGDGAAHNGGCCDTGCGGCGTCDSCCDTCCDDGCETGHWLAIGELTFFRYHRADGVRVGTAATEDVEFDFEISPRITVGYAGADGFGVRARWWEYNHTAPALGEAVSNMSVDTYTIDFEVYDTIQLNCNWTAEISAGIRMNEFEELMFDQDAVLERRENDFEGFGGLVGLELKRCIGGGSSVFARVRGAILMDDKFVSNTVHDPVPGVTLLDSTNAILELALGYEYVVELDYGVQLFGRATAEWQQWYNYSTDFDRVVAFEDFDAPSDVGFGGFAFAVGVNY